VNPYFTEQLAKEHRDDLLRAAKESHLAHCTEIEVKSHVRRWKLPPYLRHTFGRARLWAAAAVRETV